jgi:hypothetical protein
MKNNSSGSTFIAVLCVLGVLLLIGMVGRSSTPKCSKSGCDNKRVEGTSYCYLHSCYSSHSSSRKSSSSSSSSSKSSSSSSKSSGTASSSSGSTSSSSSSSSKKSSSSSKKSSASAYDDGYEAIYEDDDYDWDRYWSDSDYASGVDDAMEDLDW